MYKSFFDNLKERTYEILTITTRKAATTSQGAG